MVAHSNILVPRHRLILPGDPDFEWPDAKEKRLEGRLSPEWWSRPLWRAMFGAWPVPERGKFQLFGPSGPSGTAYQVWQVPTNDAQCMLWSVNGGSGGGGGRTDVASTQRQGGGGGSSGPYGRAAYYLSSLPRILYARAGIGGTSGAAGATGGTNTFSDWCAYPSASSNTSSADTILSGGGLSTGGVGGVTAAGTSSGGSAGTAPAASFWTLLALSFLGVAGIAGVGGVGGNGSGVAGPILFQTSPFHPGTGGGAVTGTNVETAGIAYTQGTAYGWAPPGGPVGGGNGSNGFMSDFFAMGEGALWGAGGTGGGGNAGGTGGRGGQGAWGCGGGGGGAGTTGGAGGTGGDGFSMAVTS